MQLYNIFLQQFFLQLFIYLYLGFISLNNIEHKKDN